MHTAPGQPDLRGLQILKAVCVAGMVAVHGFYWAATVNARIPVEETSALLAFVKHGMAIGILPLLLPFTAGSALRMASGGVVMQAALLAASGYVMNLLAAGWFAFPAWNVLQFAALSMLVTEGLRRVGGPPAVALAGLAVLWSSDPLRSGIRYEVGPAWIKVLLGDPMDFHTWPFFPWYALFAFGWLTVESMLRLRRRWLFRLALLAVGTTAASLAGSAGRLTPVFDRLNLIGPRIMQPPAIAAVGVIAWAAFLTLALSLLARWVTATAPYGFVRCFSGPILWIYFTHFIAGARLSQLADAYVDRRAILANPTSPAAIAWLLGFPAVLLAMSWGVGFLVLRWFHEKRFKIQLRRVERRDSASWMPATAMTTEGPR